MNAFQFGFFDELQKLANYQPYNTPESLQANAQSRLKSGYHGMNRDAQRDFDVNLDRENYNKRQMARMNPGLSNPMNPGLPSPMKSGLPSPMQKMATSPDAVSVFKGDYSKKVPRSYSGPAATSKAQSVTREEMVPDPNKSELPPYAIGRTATEHHPRRARENSAARLEEFRRTGRVRREKRMPIPEPGSTTKDDLKKFLRGYSDLKDAAGDSEPAGTPA